MGFTEMAHEFFDSIEFIINKLFSARFLMALMFSFTACYAMLHGKLSVEAFMALAGTVISSYFNKDEKKIEDKKTVV